MGWLTDLLGTLKSGAKPAKRSIPEVEKALSKLASKRAEAREGLAKETRRHDELLLVDGSDALIAKCDADADRYRLIIERCDRAEPLLLAELAALRTEAKQARWRDLRAKYETVARDYADALRCAIAKQAVMLALNDQARSEGFETEAIATFTPPMRILTADGLNEFELALDRQADVEALRAAPTPTPVAAMPVKAAPKAPPPKAAPPVPAPRPKARERIAETPAKGEIAVTVLRNGIELAGRPPLATGDIVALKPAEAEKLMRSGAADRHQGAAA